MKTVKEFFPIVDTHLRIPPPKESSSLLPRRKVIGASSRDASSLCVAAGFVKNAAELEFRILYWHITASFLV
ncbi:uncharacterized protein HKW66_Vig0048020 [Vigna angularis]|uniref:Uncharacterized protein n=1 Tax=Phaseolus angularis TaxID=3914 RepID=A0A8T0L044_PHAAN|nr:uncharacterized protein HKW66_Vig0048020 [Vigna angularis]